MQDPEQGTGWRLSPEERESERAGWLRRDMRRAESCSGPNRCLEVRRAWLRELR